MSSYNVFTTDQHSKPTSQMGHKVQHLARGTAPSPGLGFPDLYIEIHFKSDSKTKLINPANVWLGDAIILAAPFNQGLSEAFHAPTIGLFKRVTGPLLEFTFKYTVNLLGTTKVHLGLKDFISIDKEVTPKRGLVEVFGHLNTVTGEGDFKCIKAGNFDKLHVEY